MPIIFIRQSSFVDWLEAVLVQGVLWVEIKSKGKSMMEEKANNFNIRRGVIGFALSLVGLCTWVVMSRSPAESRSLRTETHSSRVLSASCQLVKVGGRARDGYGAWPICPAGLNANSIVYSFGIGGDASFDQVMVQRYGATVYAFDPTVTPADVTALFGGHDDRFKFLQIGIADYDGVAQFLRSKNPILTSRSASKLIDSSKFHEHADGAQAPMACAVLRLKTIMCSLGHEWIDLLKMDVEGMEFDIMTDEFIATLPVSQVALEFHERKFPDPREGVRYRTKIVEAFRNNGFELVVNGKEEVLFVKTRSP